MAISPIDETITGMGGSSVRYPTQSTTQGYSKYEVGGQMPAWWEQRNQYSITPEKWAAWGGDPAKYVPGWYRNPNEPGHVAFSGDYGYQDWQAILDAYNSGNINFTPQWDYNWAMDRVGNTGGTAAGGGITTLPPFPDLGGDWNFDYPADDIAAMDMLGRFGYTGPIGFNPYELTALDFIDEMYTDRPGDKFGAAEDFYNQVLSGAFGPEGQKYLDEVLGATETRAFSQLDKQSERLADRFANIGGYFGGKHGEGQGILAEDVLNTLNEITAGMNLGAFNQDIANRFGAGAGLESLGRTEGALNESILSSLAAGGNMVTGREMTNRSEYQSAMERAYADWLRARQESFLPFNYTLSLLGMQPFQNIAQQPQPSPWGGLLGGLGGILGNTIGGPLGGWLSNILGVAS